MYQFQVDCSLMILHTCNQLVPLHLNMINYPGTQSFRERGSAHATATAGIAAVAVCDNSGSGGS